MWKSHQCHGAEQSIHSYSADPAAWPPLPSAKLGGREGQECTGRVNALSYLDPTTGTCLQPFRERREDFIPFLCLFHFVLPRRAADDGHSQGMGLLSKCSWGGTGVGAKARGWADEPSPSPTATSSLLKWSTDGRTPNVHRERHSEVCDVPVHTGTLKPCSPLLWIPWDHNALHIRLYFNSCLTLPVHLKQNKEKEFKALISCFSWKIYPKTC